MVTPILLYHRLPFMRQRSRRIAVAAAFTGYPLMQVGYLLLVEPGRISSVIWGPIAFALFSMTLVGTLATYGFSQGRYDRRRGIDERQRAMVERSLIASYAVVSAVLVIALATATVAASVIGPFTVDMGLLFPIIVGVVLYEPLIPFAAFAWIEPEAPADDEA